MPRRTAAQVEASRRAILDTAVEVVSVRGFQDASIGALAKATAMSKSGLVGHFGDKRGLQLATFGAGMDAFVQRVYTPAREHPAGLPRLRALGELWLQYHERESLPGGCLMTTAAVEFDARDGAVHDAVRTALARWLGLLEREAARAIARGELPPDTAPADIAFQLNAIASWTSTIYQLDSDPAAFTRARRLMGALLGGDALGERDR